jgi:quercetin dioxygenase-like cupin family protein
LSFAAATRSIGLTYPRRKGHAGRSPTEERFGPHLLSQRSVSPEEGADLGEALSTGNSTPMVKRTAPPERADRCAINRRQVILLPDYPDGGRDRRAVMATTSGAEGRIQRVRSHQVEWKPLAEPGVLGIWVKVLRFDEETRRAPTILLKFEPGATYPAHNHPGGEEVFVIEGDVKLGKDRLSAGDYLYTPPQGKHAVWSERGCILLVNVPEEVEILKASTRSG